MPTKTLRMLFKNFEDKTSVVSIPEPTDPVVAQDVEDCMDLLIDTDFFETTGGSLVSKIRAEVVERTVDEIEDYTA